MSITEEMINNHAANGTTRGYTYGSIDKGLQVAAYRNERQKHYRSLGIGIAECMSRAQNDVVDKFGESVPL